MPENNTPSTGKDAWRNAMAVGERANERARGRRASTPSTDTDPIAKVVSGLGRALGGTSKAARANRAAERAVAKQLKAGKGDKPRATEETKLRLRATIGHVTFDAQEVYAWFTVTGVSHGFHPIADIERAIRSDAVAYSKLEGRRIRIRSTNRPYSIKQWAADTYHDATAAGRPIDSYGTDFLGRAQTHLQKASLSEKWVYLGVRVATFRKYPNDPRRELAGLRDTIDELGTTLGKSSLGASPATTGDMEWLIRRSIALGVPMPRVGVAADYERDDLPALDTAATVTGEPMSGHITVTAKVPGSRDEVTRKVTVLTLGRLSDQNIPQENQTGWMQRTDRLGFPVEWVATVDVINEQRTQSWLRGRMDIIRDQMKHYVDEHRISAPDSLKRQMAMAKDIQAQLDSDHGGTAIRTIGWYRVAVSAADEQVLKDRVARIKQVYGARAELVQTPNQYHTAREFIPGEPLATKAYPRRMSVATLAAAIPQGTAEVGDKCGVILGHTAGSGMRAVAWHTHWDMEHRARSGLIVATGGLGSGKTFALGSIVYQSAASGVQWNVLDPSDRLGRLCNLPEFKGRARYINLMKGRAGELNPFRVVADPRRDNFASDAEYEREVSDAQGMRTSLINDILYSFLRGNMRNSETTETVLTRAVSDVPALRTSSPTEILAALEAIANGQAHPDLAQEHRIRARDLVLEYTRIASTPTGKLIFPPLGAPPLADEDDSDILLNVYTLNGMQIPSAETIASGNVPENARLSMSIMTLAAWLVQSRIYLGDPGRRKGLAIDEGKTITSIDAGKGLITKTATDSRKHNLRAILCSQNVTHFDMDDESEDSLGNLIGAALIGSTEDEAACRAALKALRAPVGQGYEKILQGLRPPQKRRGDAIVRDFDGKMTGQKSESAKKRHFIFSDGSNIERIVIDLDMFPHVVDALNTNPSSYAETIGIDA